MHNGIYSDPQVELIFNRNYYDVQDIKKVFDYTDPDFEINYGLKVGLQYYDAAIEINTSTILIIFSATIIGKISEGVFSALGNDLYNWMKNIVVNYYNKRHDKSLITINIIFKDNTFTYPELEPDQALALFNNFNSLLSKSINEIYNKDNVRETEIEKV